MNNAQSILQNIIDDFSPQKFTRFFREVSVGNFRELVLSGVEVLDNDISTYNNDDFSNGALLGQIEMPDDKIICVITFSVNKPLSERSGKKAQYELAKKYLKNNEKYNAGIFIFYDEEGNFRFSLIFDIPQPKGKRDWSSFKRFTYFVSSKKPNKTFITRIGRADFTSFDQLRDAFSVDKVTKDFYREIAGWYSWAMDNIEFPDDEDKNADERNTKNLIRLITRIIFVWFMKEKNLVPPALFEKNTIDKIINYEDSTASTYYKAILQNLFFATLNTKMKRDEPNSRIFIEEAKKKGFLNEGYLQQGYYRYSRFVKDKELFLKLFENIPFLNGGLFESLDKKVNGNEIRIDCFSDNPKNESRLKVPDKLFFMEEEISVDLSNHLSSGKNKKVRGLLPILKSYNFTIDENTPIDEEVALDPELLGKVFENLLASYNPETATTARKSTGSYYTPREIVEYMVNESLWEYLKTALGIDDKDEKVETKIRNLFDYNKEENPFADDKNRTEKIIDAIEKVKILDPACGSGAFPMGILHKLVLALHKLDSENKIWKKRLLERVPAEIREETEISLHNKPLDYVRKLGLIENCIYGVDIQEIAIQISKLRFFISLLVEQEIDDTKENRDVRSLPNLETKFVAANTLIGLEKPEQLGLVSNEIDDLEKELFKKRKDLFYANSRWEKLKLQKEEKELREKLKTALQNNYFNNDVAEKIASWDPFDQNKHADWFDPEWMFGVKDGFDVVIGNPPYGIVYEKHIKSIYENSYFTFKRNNDIYVAFYQKGLMLSKKNGVLIYISANTFINGDYFKQLRKYLTRNSSVIEIIDYKNVEIFENATVMTCVFLTIKDVVKKQYYCRLKQAIESYEDLQGYSLLIEYDSDKEFKVEDPVIRKIDLLKNINSIDNLFFVKDVGFNYWSIGRKKTRGKNSIGDRILYFGKKRNSKDIPFLKGRNLFRYYSELPSNYLRHNYNEFLDENDIFRFSEKFLRISPKIIYRQTADKIIATLDENSFYLDKTVHLIVPKYDHKLELKYLLGLLNSKLFDHFYKYLSQENKGRTFSQVKTTYIKKLPIVLIPKQIQKPLVDFVDRILIAKKQNPQADTQHLEDQIDILVRPLAEWFISFMN